MRLNRTSRRVLSRGFSFLFGFGFLVGSVNGSPSSVRSTYELDTSAEWQSIPLRSSRARISLSLDTVVVGEELELENVG